MVDSADMLTLPGASQEASGLYADLMHRQLFMLTQFIYGEAEPAADVGDELMNLPAT
jgi:hypothetical protein